MASIIQNASSAWPLQNAKYLSFPQNNFVDKVVATIVGMNAWQIALTILLVLVAYDQCTHSKNIYPHVQN